MYLVVDHGIYIYTFQNVMPVEGVLVSQIKLFTQNTFIQFNRHGIDYLIFMHLCITTDNVG